MLVSFLVGVGVGAVGGLDGGGSGGGNGSGGLGCTPWVLVLLFVVMWCLFVLACGLSCCPDVSTARLLPLSSLVLMLMLVLMLVLMLMRCCRRRSPFLFVQTI